MSGRRYPPSTAQPAGCSCIFVVPARGVDGTRPSVGHRAGPSCRSARMPESHSGAHGRNHGHLRLLPPCLTLAVACSLWWCVGYGVGVVGGSGRAWADGMGATGGIGCPGTGPPSVPWFASARTIIARRACIRLCAMGSVTTVTTSCRAMTIRLRICSG